MALSCNEIKIDAPIEYGELKISLSGEPSLEVYTKTSTELDAEAAQNYNIAVYDNSECTGDPVYGPKEYSAIPNNPIILPAGTYYVFAESCTETEAETDNGTVRYAGSESVNLEAGRETTASVECSVVNVKIEVIFEDSVKGKFSSLGVTLKRETPERKLNIVYNNDDPANYVAWFNAGSVVEYSISGKSALSNEDVNEGGTFEVKIDEKTYTELPVKSHVQLKISASSSNGLLTVSQNITVNTSVNKEDITTGFNPYLESDLIANN